MVLLRPILARVVRQQRALSLSGKMSLTRSGRISSFISSTPNCTNLSGTRNQNEAFHHHYYSSTPPNLKMYEESLPVTEQEQEMIRAQSLAETGSDQAHNKLLHKLHEAMAQLEKIQQDPTSNENDIIQSLQNVASVQWDLGMLDQAQDIQEQLLSKLMRKHSDPPSSKSSNVTSDPPKHLDIAIAMHTIGSIQSRLQNPQEASKWFNASLAMKTELLSSTYSHHFEIGKTLNGLALVKMQLDQEEGIDGDPLEYVQMLEEAVRHYVHHGESMKEDGGDETGSEEDMSHHPHVAALDENIATIYRQHGDLKMAVQRYENALRVHEHWYDSSSMAGNEQIMSLNIHIGDCLQGLERYEDATGRYRTALKQHSLVVKRERREQNKDHNATDKSRGSGVLAKRSKKEATAMTGILLHNIGLMNAHLSNYDEAMQEYQEALEIKKSFGDDNPEVAKTLNAIGALLATKGEGQTAMAHFREALRIFKLNSASYEGEDFEEDAMQTEKNIELLDKSLITGRRNVGRGGTIIS